MRGSTIRSQIMIQHAIEEDIKKNIHPTHLLNWPFTIGGLHKLSSKKIEEMIKELQSIIDYRKENNDETL